MTAAPGYRPQMTALEFFDRVLPSQGQYIAFELPGRRHYVFNTAVEFAAYVEAFNRSEIFHACASYRTGESRKSENVLAIRAFWLDLDCGPGKDYPDQECALRALMTFCRATKLPKPMVLDSGGGLHLYWPLTADVAPEEWKPVATALKGLCAAYGLLADAACTTDTARILRPPGTLNRKYSPPRKVCVVGDAALVDFAEFSAAINAASLPQWPHQRPPATNNDGLVTKAANALAKQVNPNSYDISDVEDALRKLDPDCGRAEWVRIGMAIADAFGEDGRDLFVRWSRGDLWEVA